jgi:methionine-rich copper-binding protein CopC
MKVVRLALIPLLLLAFASTVFAQGAAMDSTAKPASHKSATAKSPEEMAKEALAKWKTTLKLTDEQSPQFETVMMESYKKVADAKTEAAGDKAKMKASMETILKDREEALSKVLTPDQMKTYQSQVKKNVKTVKKQMPSSTPK